MSITDACLTSNAPASTALRHTRVLIEHGHVLTTPDQTDLRRTWVSLSSETGDLVERLLDRTATELLRALEKEKAGENCAK